MLNADDVTIDRPEIEFLDFLSYLPMFIQVQVSAGAKRAAAVHSYLSHVVTRG